MAMAMASSSSSLLISKHPSHKPYRRSSSSNPTTFSKLPTKTQPPPLQVSDESPNSKPKKPPSIRARLSRLCQEGRIDRALHLFNAIPKPTTVIWNTIIIGLICNGMPHEALCFYARMITFSSIKSDSYTYSSALKACAETRDLKLGKSVHCRILRSHLNLTRIVSNSLLSMYSNCLNPSSFELLGDKLIQFKQFDSVQKVFDNMRQRNVVTWNTIIAWYVKTGRFTLALKQFQMMMEFGIKPTVVSFINVFPAIGPTGDQKNSCVLYGLLLKFGNEYCNDLFAVSSAIFMFSELADIDSARRVFDLSMGRNIEVWNTMIGGYVQNDCCDEGLDLFLRVLELDQIVPDTVTFLATLIAVSQLQRLGLGQQLHSYLIKKSMEMPVVISNALIAMYSRCNSVQIGFEVFEKMPVRDLVSWNTMVCAFVQNGLDDEGLMLVYEMKKQGIRIDSITATALLSAASNLRNREIGKQTHAYIFRHGIQFEGMDSYLIDMYAKSGLIDTAQRLFETDYIHARDQVTWNAMIAGYTQNGQTEQTFAAFRQMLEQNEIPNSVTLASVIPACNPSGGISAGKQLHCFSLRHSMEQNVFVGTALLDMYSKCGAVDEARRVFDRLPERDFVSWTSMITAYGSHGQASEALELFRKMKKSKAKPDRVTFLAVISACSHGGLVDEGCYYFNQMKNQYGIQPTLEHYSCLIDLLGRAGRLREAYEILLHNTQTIRTDVDLLSTLLSACNMHGDLELGEEIAGLLMEKDPDDPATYVVLSNMYASVGRWNEVRKVRLKMKELGLKKNPGCSWIEVEKRTHSFFVEDKSHPSAERIYECLTDLIRHMEEDKLSSFLHQETLPRTVLSKEASHYLNY